VKTISQWFHGGFHDVSQAAKRSGFVVRRIGWHITQERGRRVKQGNLKKKLSRRVE